jgi:2-keto-4-pentenoate hydratase/2-oxohepta-3-ene-1,7-dioic acid hydratase in catechol pathway
MRWIRYTADTKTSYGIVEGDRVVEVQGTPFGSYKRTSKVRPLDSVKIEVPVVPPTFYCAGRNYPHHIREMAAKRGEEPVFPKKPDIGYRATNALIAHKEPIIIPHDATEKIQYEGELVVIIGKKAKHLSEGEALGCVLGYTVGNDISERTWQRGDGTMWRAKNTDTFKPMGPWIETDVKLDDLETIVSVNGEVTTRFPTNDMIFGIANYISAMTRYLTLHPGDIIWMGTDDVSPDLKAGDVVDIEITGIGTLSNPLEAEQAQA